VIKADPVKYRAYLDRVAKWQDRNPEKAKAHYKVKDSKLKGLCFCGKPGQAHHEDYKKPLEVTWLCPRHHKLLHLNILKAGVT